MRAPIVLVWDRLGTHTSKAMQQLVATRPWLTVFLLPAYAPELNPVEGGVVAVQGNPGQPHLRNGRPARGLGPQSAQEPAVPAHDTRRLHGRDRTVTTVTSKRRSQ
ncbi:transposase [Streptomyces sp. NPDC057074]|uniref:transposase n=1 Tax=Streptomyces sp. NPDC057074 TaxID=3346015 RepID=UPI00362F3A32